MGDLRDGLFGAGDEDGFLQQIGGRISADGQFWEDDELRVRINGTLRKLKNFPDVTVEVPDGRIDLGKRNLHVDSVSEAFEMSC